MNTIGARITMAVRIRKAQIKTSTTIDCFLIVFMITSLIVDFSA